MADLVGNLNGTGNLDGTITVLGKIEQQVGSVGLNLLGQLAQQKLGAAGTQIQGLTQLADAAYSAFIGVPNSLTGDFLVRNGTVNTDNLALANANARALAQGAANLPAWTLDMIATIFRAPDLNSPFLELGLNGLLDAPNTKFKGFQPVSAPTGTDLLQQVIPGTTGGETTSPGGILQQVIPGTAPAPSGTQPAPGTQPGVLPQVLPGILGTGTQGETAPQPGSPGATGTAAPTEEAVPQPEPGVVPQPEPEVAPQPGAEVVPLPEPEVVPQPEPEVVPQPEPEIVPQPEPEIVPQPETGTEAVPQPDGGAAVPGASGLDQPAAPAESGATTETPPEMAPADDGSGGGVPGSGGAAPGDGGVQPGAEQQPLNNLLQNLIQPSQ
jgi:hypothetical protein